LTPEQKRRLYDEWKASQKAEEPDGLIQPMAEDKKPPLPPEPDLLRIPVKCPPGSISRGTQFHLMWPLLLRPTVLTHPADHSTVSFSKRLRMDSGALMCSDVSIFCSAWC
jgi:hypothetical protein